jgi:hypothetical protein
MSKAQTDIRTTSYNIFDARPDGYSGTIDDALAQIRSEEDRGTDPTYTRYELLGFLGVNNVHSNGPSVELDESPRYGDELSTEPNFFTLAYAMKRWPENFRVPDNYDHQHNIGARLAKLSLSQLQVYLQYRLKSSVNDALVQAENYPYPAPKS